MVLPEAAEEAHYFLRRLDEHPYVLQFTRSAVVFDFSKPGTEPAENENGIEFYRIGSDLIRQLVESAVTDTETMASVQYARSVDTTREVTQELLRRRELAPAVPTFETAAFLSPPRDRTLAWDDRPRVTYKQPILVSSVHVREPEPPSVQQITPQLMADARAVPSSYITDRGPGAALKLIEKFDDEFPIRELTLAYSGQSKATVESSNPRKRKIEGRPGYFQSKFTPVKLARKLICDFIKRNRTRWIEDKIEGIPEMAFVSPDPLSFWNAYNDRGRNDAQMMSVEDAVRSFLTPKKFSLKEDGVYLAGRRFNSDKFKATGIFQKLKRSPVNVMEINGYVLDLCVRHLWVEVDGQLYQLDAHLKVGDFV